MVNLNEYRANIAQMEEIDDIVLEPQKAEGIYVWDTSGKKYIDLLSGICVGNVGHRNPKVIEAVKHQMDDYMHIMVYGEYAQRPQLSYAKRLKEFLPKELAQIFYVNSGSEAVEGAIKSAKLYNHKKKIISYKKSYHGSTLALVSLLSDKRFTECFEPLLPYTDSIEFNNIDDLQKIDSDTCCVVAEAVAVGEGVDLPKCGYLKKLRERCDEVGAVLILDEIQTGFGRTGKLFAFEHYGFVPDILCIAKSMGGGLPIGAFIGKEDIMQRLNNHHPLIGHATTFGGNAVCISAAMASFEYIIDNHLMDSVEEKGKYFRSLLVHKHIKDVRGIGLFNCIEMNETVDWKNALISCFKHGIITGTHLFNPMCLSIKPPLIITKEEIEESAEKILKAFDEI